MKALSIKQPWAWLIANGHKTIENRTWDTQFRGKFLIHTGKRPDPDIDEIIWYFRRNNGIMIPDKKNLKYGGFIGIVNLEKVVTRSFNPWHIKGQFGFVLNEASEIDFIPYKGQLNFFPVSIDNITISA